MFSPDVPVHAADITGSVIFKESNARYNRLTGKYSFDASIQNDSSKSFSSPIIVVITNISHPLVSISNSDGFNSAGNPFFDYSDSLNDGILEPSETSRVKKW